MSDISERLLEARISLLLREDFPDDWPLISTRARGNARRWALATAAVLTAIVLSAPALGWHRTVMDWLDAEEAAPAVKLEFARLGVQAPPEHKLGIEHEQARTVTTVKSRGKSYVLSVAPTKNGGFCFWWADLTASCRQSRTPPAGFRERGAADFATFRLGTIWSPDSAGVIQSVAGNVIGPDAERLRAVYADGEVAEIPLSWVSSPIDAGFYLYFTPDRHRRPGAHMTALEATDGNGEVVARQTYKLTPASEIERPARLPDGRAVSLPAKAIPARAEKLIDFTASNGRQITLWEMPTTEGGVCYVSNVSGGCPPGPLDVPLATGLSGGNVVLFLGQARADVTWVVLRFQDGSEERIRPVRGYVLTEILPSHYAQGRRPVEAVALGPLGEEVGRHPISTSVGIYPCEEPVDQGFGVMACP